MPMDSAPLIKEPEPAHVEQEFGQEDDWYETLTGEKRSRATLMNTGHAGLTDAEAAARIRDFGRNCLPEKERNIWLDLAKQFWGPMPGMIWGAIIIEAVIASTKSSREWADFSVLLVLQILNAVLGWYEDMKAGDAVDALKNALKPQCDVKRNGKWLVADATMLVPGDRVKLCAGGGIPADCEICESQIISVDQAALTGESMPVSMRKHDKPKMGSTVTRGETEALVFATGSQTFFGKTAALIGSVDEEGHFQKILMRITIFLLVMSCILVSIAFFVLMHRGGGFLEALVFCVVLLVASIPIALPVVSTSTMALGSKSLAAEKAIVTRLASIEEVAGMNMLCSDKTGTLTKGKMELQDDIDCDFTPGISRDDVLMYSALAAKWEEPAKDAIDTLVLSAVKAWTKADEDGNSQMIQEGQDKLNKYRQVKYEPFDPERKMTEATLQGPDGLYFSVAKGAPQVLLHGLDPARFPKDFPGVHDAKTLEAEYDGLVKSYSERGIRTLTVARSKPNKEDLTPNEKGKDPDNRQWEMMGIITFKDPPRSDTREVIKAANGLGVEVKMITGDHAVIAREMARTIGMGTDILDTASLGGMKIETDPETREMIVPKDLGVKYGQMIEQCNGFAQVFPEHKFLIVEALRQRGWATGMTGDGVNDAPALKKADIGIAVQGATQAAQASADIVLTREGLGTIVTAIKISRMIFQRLKNYVTYRIACTIQLLLFFFIGVCFIDVSAYPVKGATTDQFQLPVLAIVLITALNDGTIISIAYDFVHPSPLPETWRLPEVFTASTLLGLVAVISSIMLLLWSLNSAAAGSMMQTLGVCGTAGLSYGKVQTIMYLKISCSDFLTVFAARTRGPFFIRKPATLLLAAACFAMGLSSILARTWPFGELEPLTWKEVGFVWIYCLVWFLAQDFMKVILYAILDTQRETGQNAGDPASRKDIAVLEARLVAVEAKMSEISTAATAGAVVQKVGKGHGIN